jgi:hypothetical protein
MIVFVPGPGGGRRHRDRRPSCSQPRSASLWGSAPQGHEQRRKWYQGVVADPDHVGIRADFGGGVVGLEDVTAYPKITVALLKRGLSESVVEKIWGGNELCVLRAAEEFAKKKQTVSAGR